MTRQIKLIWDFRGPQALPTARHHEIHLKDFITSRKLEDPQITGVVEVQEMHSFAYWVVSENEMKEYRDLLKPHRATLYSE